MKTAKSFCALALACAALPSYAAADLVLNGSFEDVTMIGTAGTASTPLTSYTDAYRIRGGVGVAVDLWGTADNTGATPGASGNMHLVYNGGVGVDCSTKTGTQCTMSYGVTAHDGNKFVDLTGAGTDRIISQDLTTVAGVVYELTYYVMNSSALNGGATNSVKIGVDGDYSTVSVAGSSSWQKQVMTFVAADTTTTLSFQAGGTGASYALLGLDSVSVSAIPEPEMYALFVAGLLVIGARRRRAGKAS